MAVEYLQQKLEVAREKNAMYAEAHTNLVKASRAAAAADVLAKKLAVEAAEAEHDVRLAQLKVEEVTIGKLIGYEYI